MTTTTLEQKVKKPNSSSNNNRTGRSTFQKCRFRSPKSLKGLQFSPLCFLKHLADKVTRALHFMAMKRNRPLQKQPVPAVPLASSKAIQVPATVDSHRTEAVEDCIKYINAST
ncbi:josephin-like protein [Cucumis melo var. makuwa]|uniref:Josephin-like protein n=2 Tax=Cucumis melo TaxID=3656 RepID=A0A5A7V4L5_CUCMM|nr:josephin-like protein [Cucumis melo var. makuwa]TYK15409.1 josephin-like protein [Cucumis melo var. makuwa]